MEITREAVGLRKLRKQSGLSQAELAAKAGIAQQAISDYETNHRTPSLMAAEKIAYGLDTTVDMVAKAIKEQRSLAEESG